MSETPIASAPATADVSARHPRGLITLFFTEMWERFSYYGMRALLVLFMVDKVRGGLGMNDEVATAVYGLYTATVYLACLPGGWVADRLLGAQRSVWYGGIIIALGHFTLAIPRTETFFLGLVFVATGTGLLKPNISACVGELYPEGGARRDAGFSIFYMGINLGAFVGPLICSTLGEKYNWHYGFGAAGVGMVLGLIQFRLSRNLLGSAGVRPGKEGPLSPLARFGGLFAVAAAVIVVGMALGGVLKINPVTLADNAKYALSGIAVVYFSCVLLFVKLDRTEKQHVGVIVILFIAAALFWAGFEQAGSTFNLFAERYTNRFVGSFEVPTGWYQSLGPVFVIIFAPVAAALWVQLARRNLNPSIPVKFGLGLILLGVGFLIMAGAAKEVIAHQKVWPTWLIMTYLIHTFGELCLSPVGLSSVTKLAPRRLVGQMMGTWFLAASLGSLLAGLIAGWYKEGAVNEMPALYLQQVIMPMAAGLLLIILSRPIKRWMTGIK